MMTTIWVGEGSQSELKPERLKNPKKAGKPDRQHPQEAMAK
jgi:hypothetical protein